MIGNNLDYPCGITSRSYSHLSDHFKIISFIFFLFNRFIFIPILPTIRPMPMPNGPWGTRIDRFVRRGELEKMRRRFALKRFFFTHISPAICPRIFTPISPAIRPYLAGELSAISPYFDVKLHAHFYP